MDEQKETLEQIKERMTQMRDRLKVLEWDDNHKQINPYKKMELERMRKEYSELQDRLTGQVIEV